MLKALSLIVLIAVISGSDASNKQYEYSPYTRQLSNRVPLKTTNKDKMVTSTQRKNLMPLQKMMPTTRPIAPPPMPMKEDFCRGRQAEDRIPFPGDSNKFIVCHLGEVFDIMSCPRQLVFNTITLNCEHSFRAPLKMCERNPCANSGRCIEMPFNQFKCECPTGFTGKTCMESTSCTPTTCGQTGLCLQMPVGAPVAHFCMCDNGLTYGMACDHRVEANPCTDNHADLHSFPSKTNRALFVQCEGHLPHIKFCAYPLVYSHSLQRCDWE